MKIVRGVYFFEARKQWWIHVVHTATDGTKTEVRQRSPINSQPAAVQHRNKVIGALENGTWQKHAGTPTLETVCTEFYQQLRALGRKESTIEWYQDQLERVLFPVFKTTLIDRIVGAPLDAWIASRPAKLEAGTINGALRALRRVLRLAWERGYVKNRPVVKMRARTTEKKFRFLTFEEADKLIETAKPFGQWLGLIVLGIRAGLRIGELIGLKWEDLDLDGRKLHVGRSRYRHRETLPKGNKARTIPLTAQAVTVLRSLRHLRGPYVFCNEDGSPLTRHDARVLRPIAIKAGLKPLGPHTLRHTFGSHCAMKGFNIREVQAWMGHASISTTEIYFHIAPSKENRLDVLDGVQA